MKLLTPQANNDIKAINQARDIMRSQEIQKLSEKVRTNLANAEMEFKLTLARNSEEWAKREQDHQKRVLEMKKEVEDLENRKKQALIPLKVYEDQAHKILQEAQNYKSELEERESGIDKLRELLEDKLDSVGNREQNIRTKEIKLGLREQGIEDQSRQVIEGIKKLNEEIAKFAIQRTEIEKDINVRKTNLILSERTLEGKKESLNRTEKALSDWAIRLRDTEERLKRNEKRISPL